jgi:hypothetical protein
MVPTAVPRTAACSADRTTNSASAKTRADLTIGDDVKAGVFLRADREQRRVGLGLVKELGSDAPQLAGADPGREPAG